MSLLRNQDQAEEIAQDAWLGVLGKNLKAGTKQFSSYLRVAVRNGVMKVWRDESSQAFKDEDGARSEALPSTLEGLAEGECSDMLRQAVTELEEPYRSVISLHYFDDLSLMDISKRLGLNDSTVRSHLRRAVVRLRQKLDGDFGRKQWATGLLLMLKKKSGWVPTPSDKLIPLTLESAGISAAAMLTALAAALALAFVPLFYSYYSRLAPGEHTVKAAALASDPADQDDLLLPISSSPSILPVESEPRSLAPSLAATAEQAPGTLWLNVVDRTTGLALTGVRVLETGKEDYPQIPTSAPRNMLFEGAPSPVSIGRTGTQDLRSLWVAADGYAWQFLKVLDPAKLAKSSQMVTLDPAADLELVYDGPHAFKDASLFLRQPGAPDFVLKMPKLAGFPMRLSGLPAGPIEVIIASESSKGLVANGDDFYVINPDVKPIFASQPSLDPLGLTQLLVEPYLGRPSAKRFQVDLQFHMEQPMRSERGRATVLPATLDGFARLPKGVTQPLHFDPEATSSSFSLPLELPKGLYHISINPSMHFEEFEVLGDGPLLIEPARAEDVILELSTSFWGNEQRPEKLLITRIFDQDHPPMSQPQPIDWELSTCNLQLVPGRYNATPLIHGALYRNIQSLRFEVLPGQTTQLPLEWERDGLKAPVYGFRIELRYGNTIVPINCPDVDLTPIGHDGILVPYSSAQHPRLFGPGRFKVYPLILPSPGQRSTPWAAQVRVSEVGRYLLGSFTKPPYLPTKPRIIQVTPGAPHIETFHLTF